MKKERFRAALFLLPQIFPVLRFNLYSITFTFIYEKSIPARFPCRFRACLRRCCRSRVNFACFCAGMIPDQRFFLIFHNYYDTRTTQQAAGGQIVPGIITKRPAGPGTCDFSRLRRSAPDPASESPKVAWP